MEVQKMQIKSNPAMELTAAATAKTATAQNNDAVKATFADKQVSIVLGAASLLTVGSFIIGCQYFNLDYFPSAFGAMTILIVSLVGFVVISPPEKTEPDFVPDVAWGPSY
jgi:uncharacterized membrane protein